MLEQKFDEAPWTTRETWQGILLTLVPWVVIGFGLSGLNINTTVNTPLPPRVDVLNAIIVLVLTAVIEGAFLIAPFYFATRAYRSVAAPARRRAVLQALGFRSFDVRRALLWIVLLFLASYMVNVLYQYIITTLHLHLQTNDQFILARSKSAPFSTYALLIGSVIIAPLCEELFFRSFVFMGLLRSMPVIWAIVLSAFLFALAHNDPGSFTVLFFIGLALAFLRWRTRSVWPGILLHVLNNGIGAILIILVMQGVIHQ